MIYTAEIQHKEWRGKRHRTAVTSYDGIDYLVVEFFAGTRGSILMHVPLEDVKELYLLLDMADGHVNGYGGEE